MVSGSTGRLVPPSVPPAVCTTGVLAAISPTFVVRLEKRRWVPVVIYNVSPTYMYQNRLLAPLTTRNGLTALLPSPSST